MDTQGQVEELWVDSAKVTNLDDPAATRKSAIQAAKERGCEYNSSIQGTVFYYTCLDTSIYKSMRKVFLLKMSEVVTSAHACESMRVRVDVGERERKPACVFSCLHASPTCGDRICVVGFQ